GGRAVGIGQAFRETMERLDRGVPPAEAASTEWPWNGAAMRVGPVALLDWRRPDRLVDDVLASSQVTHREPSAVAAAVAVATAAVYALTHDAIDPAGLASAVAEPVERHHAELAAQIADLPALLALDEEAAWRRLLALPGALRPGRTADGLSGDALPA